MNTLLQAAPGGLFGGGSGGMLLIGAMFVVMYFFMIRPQQKKAKLQKQFIDNLKEGDKIVTIAGIHGKIKRFYDATTMQLEVSPGTFLTVERSSISMDATEAINKAAAGTATVTK